MRPSQAYRIPFGFSVKAMLWQKIGKERTTHPEKTDKSFKEMGIIGNERTEEKTFVMNLMIFFGFLSFFCNNFYFMAVIINELSHDE